MYFQSNGGESTAATALKPNFKPNIPFLYLKTLVINNYISPNLLHNSNENNGILSHITVKLIIVKKQRNVLSLRKKSCPNYSASFE